MATITPTIRLVTIGKLCEMTQAMPAEIITIADQLKLAHFEVDGVAFFTAKQVAAIRAEKEKQNAR